MNPLITHPLISSLEAFALTMILSLARGLGLDVAIGFPIHHAPVLAALVVSAFYCGREAGQREHDLKHLSPPKGAVMACLGAQFLFLWSRDNLVQWLVAAGATSVVAAALTIAGY